MSGIIRKIIGYIHPTPKTFGEALEEGVKLARKEYVGLYPKAAESGAEVVEKTAEKVTHTIIDGKAVPVKAPN